jgi:3-hydroxyisobutyrate dehydrogenase
MKVGFIGLGNMGAGMALNLRKAGYDLVVYDIHKESAQPLVEAGASLAESVAALGRAADVMFTSLPGPKEMEAVADELLSSMRPGSAWFDLTTNSVTVVREVCARFQEKGIAMLDAPVSGGPLGARSGKLAIYAGGDRTAFDRHSKLLDAISDRVIYVGPIGAGTVAKLVHNLISFVLRMTIAEGMSLGVKAGLDPLELWYAVRQGAQGRARTLDLYSELYLQGKYEPPGFALRLAHKDFRLPMKMSEAAYEDFTAALERGWGDLDARSPMQLQNERAGVSIHAAPEDVQKMLARG